MQVLVSRSTLYGEAPGSEALPALVSLGCGIGVVPRLVLEKSPLRLLGLVRGRENARERVFESR
jgi:DNA-binding transcriptional LysR family regulator